MRDKQQVTEQVIFNSSLFLNLEAQLNKTLEESQHRLQHMKQLTHHYDQLKQEKLALVHSETHLKAEVARLRGEAEEQTRRLAEVMKSSQEEGDRLR